MENAIADSHEMGLSAKFLDQVDGCIHRSLTPPDQWQDIDTKGHKPAKVQRDIKSAVLQSGASKNQKRGEESGDPVEFGRSNSGWISKINNNGTASTEYVRFGEISVCREKRYRYIVADMQVPAKRPKRWSSHPL